MVIQAGTCVKCGALQSAAARVGCANPQWHDGYVEQEHFRRTCESQGCCPCCEVGLRCCTCRDRNL